MTSLRVVLALLSVAIRHRVSAAHVTVEGRSVLVDGAPLSLKGINWNPVPIGGKQGHGGVDFRGFVETDSELMRVAGINALRTYEPITDREVLDILWSKGIYVVNTVYVAGDEEAASVVGPVSTLKDHPAILMWAVGNEWNYNMLYSDMQFPKALARVRQVVQLIKSLDSSHPVSTIHGMLPPPSMITALADVDVWGLTAYTGLSFLSLFKAWRERTGKPMFLAEYGADAYNTKVHQVDEPDQAKAVRVLSDEIIAHSVTNGGVCTGGFLFELADEWWKDNAGSASTHDIGGVAPGIGPFPDKIFNEEYWGIVKADGSPREAYRAYAGVLIPGVPAAPTDEGASLVKPGFRNRACGASPGCVGLLGDCCPDKNGGFNDCCSDSARAPAETHVVAASVSVAPLEPWTPQASETASGGVAPQTMPLQASAGSAGPVAHCEFTDPVPCCLEGQDCGTCAGDQCCPTPHGLSTCPSASLALAPGCFHPKLYDCTGKTGTEAPSTPAPAGGSQWSPTAAATQTAGASAAASQFTPNTRGSTLQSTTGPSDTSAVTQVIASVMTLAFFGSVAALYVVVWRKVRQQGLDGDRQRGMVAVYDQALSWGTDSSGWPWSGSSTEPLR